MGECFVAFSEAVYDFMGFGAFVHCPDDLYLLLFFHRKRVG